MDLLPWYQRTWTFQLPAGAFPAVLERLRGSPVRALALVEWAPDRALSYRPGGAWSAKDHIGHLDDLHELDLTRVREFLAGVPTLSAADRENRLTHGRLHSARPLREIVEAFERRRAELVALLEPLTEAEIERRAVHPRLRIPVRLIDWAEFVADHDDHHLAAARAALRQAAGA
jgi:hypothetical protein